MSFDPLLDRHDAVLNAIRDATDAIVNAMHDLAQALKPAPVVAPAAPEKTEAVVHDDKGAIYHEPVDWAAKDVPVPAPKPFPDLEPHPAPVVESATPAIPEQIPAKPLPEFSEPKPPQDIPGARPLALTDL